MFGRLPRDPGFHLQNSENEANLFVLLLLSTRRFSVFFNRKPRFRQDQSETYYFQEFVFDWEICFHLYELYRFQVLIG